MSERWQQTDGSTTSRGATRGRETARESAPATEGERGQGELIWQSRLQKMLQQAEQNLADGALTAGYKANPEQIVALLNRALASEWSSFLQYWHHSFMASDLHSAEIKEIFKEHAEDEYEHARRFGERIQQLGGVPCDKPEDIARLTPTPTEYNHDLCSMLEADLVGERATIDFYEEVIRTCGFDDNVTRKIFEDIVEEEAHHADELATLLFAYDGSTARQIESIHDQITRLAPTAGEATGRLRRTA